MINRTFRRLFLLCLLVNAISGSVPRFYSTYPTERQTRHASCPSCRREQPDALVSWSMPLRREDQDLEAKPDTWQTNRPFKSNSFFNRSPYTNLYNRASRSRGAPALDSVTPSENPYQPRSPIARNSARSSFINPSFYDMIEHQSDIKSSNGYFKPHLSHSVPYEDFKDPKVMYRAEKYRDEITDERTSSMVPAEQYPRRIIPYRGASASVDTHMHDVEEFPQDRRDQSEESRVIYEPEVKYNVYKSPADTNVFRMFQNVGKPAVNNTSRWQQRFQERRKEEAENNSFKEKENGNQMKVKMTMEMNDGGQSEDHFHSHESERVEDAKNKRNTMRVNNSSRDKSPGESSTQSEFVEDIEPVRQASPVYLMRSTSEPPMMP
ncbi:hypothetical protein ANTPLA_LOCUS9795 [Anthophora plagiata]